MSKRIIRKSIASIPIEGMICDTLNIKNESINAPSIRLARQLMGLPVGTVVAYDGEDIPEGFEEISMSKVLWENPTPNATYFSDTSDIVLPNNSYEYFRIIVKHNSSTLIFDIVPGENIDLTYTDYLIEDSLTKIVCYHRACTSESNTHISFAYCNYYKEGNVSYQGNQYLKPLKVIGYNLGTLEV